MGVFTGSGFLDLSIVTEGVRGTPVIIKVLSSLPHLVLGAIGIGFGWLGHPRAARPDLADAA